MARSQKDHDSLIRLEEQTAAVRKDMSEIKEMLKTTCVDCKTTTERHAVNLRVINWVGACLATLVMSQLAIAFIKN